ncbi:MAG: hypothetical protein WCE21_05835 [Candidatus Babeliales bacterium]
MKKVALILLVTASVFADEHYFPLGRPLFFAPAKDRRQEATGQSFMFTRPIHDNIAAKYASFWHEALWEKQGCWGFSVQIVPLYQKNMANSSNARYFFIDHTDTLTIRGDAISENPNVRMIRAEWLNLPSNFFGTLRIAPHQHQFGIWVEASQDIKTFINHPFLDNIWVAVAFPFQTATTNLKPKSITFQTEENVFPSTPIEAFNRGNMIFGKIKEDHSSRSGICEVHFRLGTTFVARDGFVAGLYSSIIAPTFNPQRAEYMFSPFLGHNGHWGLGAGAYLQLPLNIDTEDKLMSFFLEIDNQYLLRNFQWRTFDLVQKPFSRYLLLNKNDGTTNIPAVNIFTQRVKVQPFNFVDMAVGFRFNWHRYEAEIAYNLWAHGDEYLSLKHHFEPEYGIQGNGALIPGTNIGVTASHSTISTLAPNDTDFFGNPIFVPIHEYDFDFITASARGAVAHRASFAFGFIHDQCSFALFAGLGAFAELSQRNTALNNWGIWGKAGGTF